MSERYDYGSWYLNHPLLGTLVFAGPGVVLGAIGVGLAWLLTTLRVLSPDNVLAGFGFGCGFACAGLIVGVLIISRT